MINTRMEVKEPIFIFGTGRNGSTAFFDLFSRHPNVAWLSELNIKFPDKPYLNRSLLFGIDIPLIGRYLRRLGPGECYPFWEYHCKGFSQPCRDLLAGDVTTKTKDKIHSVLSQNLTSKRNRLLIKVTGWPRVGFFHELYKDAKFIHIVRDGRAVANSMLNVRWWDGWLGPQNWRYGELPTSLMEVWKKFDRSFVALAAIEWKILIEAAEIARQYVDPTNFLEIHYEDFCDDPEGVFEVVIQFCNLDWSTRFQNEVIRYPIKNMNYKWRSELTVEQQRIIQAILSDCH